MRRTVSLLLVAALAVAALSGIGSAGEKKYKLSGKKLIVGTMANHLGLPVQRAREAGYFKDVGLDVEILIFATGAPINEAMAAGKLDLAVSGLATVHALSTGAYKYIGDGIRSMSGDGVFVRPDSIYAKTPGPKKGLLGDAKTVKGAKILGPSATSAQYIAIKYVEALGLTADDFDMVSMDFAQALQAFHAGQGDMVSSTPPYSNQLLGMGYVAACDLVSATGQPIVDANYAQKDVVAERREDVKAFLDCYYRASKDLNDDPELRRSLGMKWYAEEGKTVNEQIMNYEITQKSYNTLQTLLEPGNKFGGFMVDIGEFFTRLGMIPQENYPNIAASMDSSIVAELKAEAKK